MRQEWPEEKEGKGERDGQGWGVLEVERNGCSKENFARGRQRKETSATK